MSFRVGSGLAVVPWRSKVRSDGCLHCLPARKPSTAASNSCGALRFGAWPTPSNLTSLTPVTRCYAAFPSAAKSQSRKVAKRLGQSRLQEGTAKADFFCCDNAIILADRACKMLIRLSAPKLLLWSNITVWLFGLVGWTSMQAMRSKRLSSPNCSI